MNPRKFWLKSKTILFNLGLTLLGSWTAIEASLGNLRESISPTRYGVLMTAVGILGVILRLATTQPVSSKR